MKDREDLLSKAAAHLRAGRIAAGKEILEGLPQEDSCDLEALGLMGAVSMLDGDPSKAEAYYRAILKQRPDDLRATLELADAFYDQGKIESAIECAEAVLSRDESCLPARQKAATGHLQEARDHAAMAPLTIASS